MILMIYVQHADYIHEIENRRDQQHTSQVNDLISEISLVINFHSIINVLSTSLTFITNDMISGNMYMVYLLKWFTVIGFLLYNFPQVIAMYVKPLFPILNFSGITSLVKMVILISF